MKSVRSIALGVLVAISAFSALMYTSCSKTKDACSGVTCQHGGVCNNGACTCNYAAGYTGAYCDTAIRTLFNNKTYMGNGTDDATPTGGPYQDTKMTLTPTSDTGYTNMSILVQIKSVSTGIYSPFVSGNVVLSNFSATSASFTITPYVASNGFRYSGSGTVSLTGATLSIAEADTATVSPLPTINYNWSSMPKQ